MRLSIAVLLALSSTAHAAPEVAVAVNSPLSIIKGFAFGVSGYVAIGDNDALRANVATYESDYLWEDEYDANLSGRKYDVSISWVHYPRRVYDGALVDIGMLGRRHHSVSYNYDFDSPNWTLRTNTIAARAMVGWSWLIYGHAFIAVAAGVSVGHEFGTVTGWMAEQTRVSRGVAYPESYVRVGAAF